ncbi:hypothetical protein [Campylobacter vicugnae]|uniref:hypothetical protein n=1 Tax=Campylobacter vicugnae TaxID=1660076 RepID=UPI0030CAE726
MRECLARITIIYGKNNHSLQLNKRTSKIDIVRALNSINTVAKNANNNYINAFSDNGYFIVFNGDEIVTCFRPDENKKKAFDYFKRKSIYDKKEVIKWRIVNLI